MIMSGALPKRRMAPVEIGDDVVQRVARERRAADLQREAGLEGSLAPFRVGSVSYLNAVPLTRGLGEQIIFVAPSRLAEMLQAKELDAALVSTSEDDVLFEVSSSVLIGLPRRQAKTPRRNSCESVRTNCNIAAGRQILPGQL